jgi:hypothetical protein
MGLRVFPFQASQVQAQISQGKSYAAGNTILSIHTQCTLNTACADGQEENLIKQCTEEYIADTAIKLNIFENLENRFYSSTTGCNNILLSDC